MVIIYNVDLDYKGNKQLQRKKNMKQSFDASSQHFVFSCYSLQCKFLV